MNKFFSRGLIWLGILVWAGGLIPSGVMAGLTYQDGYYTNLCESGTAATYYNCDPGCVPATGSCSGENEGVVKWVCQGKWNQCLESESQWSNFEKLDTVSCGYTVQLSVFDKKCRRLDGSWDSTCRLMGYMTWYSGDCYDGQPTAAVTPAIQLTPTQPVPTPTVKPTAAVTAVPTQSPTPVPTTPAATNTPAPSLSVTPTPTFEPALGMCGLDCKLAGDCRIGFACMAGECRNPACPADKDCFCRGVEAATAAAVLNKSPETGVETWLGMAGMAGLGAAGWKLRKLAKKVW